MSAALSRWRFTMPALLAGREERPAHTRRARVPKASDPCERRRRDAVSLLGFFRGLSWHTRCDSEAGSDCARARYFLPLLPAGEKQARESSVSAEETAATLAAGCAAHTESAAIRPSMLPPARNVTRDARACACVAPIPSRTCRAHRQCEMQAHWPQLPRNVRTTAGSSTGLARRWRARLLWTRAMETALREEAEVVKRLGPAGEFHFHGFHVHELESHERHCTQHLPHRCRCHGQYVGPARCDPRRPHAEGASSGVRRRKMARREICPDPASAFAVRGKHIPGSCHDLCHGPGRAGLRGSTGRFAPRFPPRRTRRGPFGAPCEDLQHLRVATIQTTPAIPRKMKLSIRAVAGRTPFRNPPHRQPQAHRRRGSRTGMVA